MVTLAFILLAAQSAPVLIPKRTQDVELVYDISFLKRQTNTINEKLGTLLDRQHVIQLKLNDLLYGDIEDFAFMTEILEEHDQEIEELQHAQLKANTTNISNENSSEVDVRLYEEFGEKLLNFVLSEMVASSESNRNINYLYLAELIQENEYKIEDLKYRLDSLE